MSREFESSSSRSVESKPDSDPTCRVWTDEEFRQVLESAPDAMVIANENDEIVLVNAQAVRLFGWPRHQMVGQDVMVLIPERFRERHRESRKGYLENPRPRVMGEDDAVFGLKKDGEEFPIEISVSPLETGRGRFVVSSIRDISQRREAEGALKESVRRFAIHRADRYLLSRNVHKLYAQSKTVAERLRTWGGHEAEVVYPPPPEREYRTDGYENFVFAVSRLHPLKRLDLLIRAMKQVRSTELRAVIAGTGEDEERLRGLAGELGVDDRVEFVGRVSEEALVDYYARCRGVFFAPYMEDYGFVTLEAFRSKKP